MNRRRLLGAVGWLVISGSARAAVQPPPSLSRRLKLFNAHTGETFDGPYRGADGVIASAAAELSEFLRDFHSGVSVTMDMGVVDFLWEVLDAVNADHATVLSAYRTPETNTWLSRTTFGVAEHSQHMYARAIDFTIGSALDEAMTAARKMRRGGVGWYPGSRFIHVDSGPVRNWDLGDGNLQQLLTGRGDDRAQRLRSASLRRPNPSRTPDTAEGEPSATSQYAGSRGVADVQLRPSQYNRSSYGVGDAQVRPSQYNSGS